MKRNQFECLRKMLLGIAVLALCVLLMVFGVALGGETPGVILIWASLFGGIGAMVYTVNAYLTPNDPDLQ